MNLKKSLLALIVTGVLSGISVLTPMKAYAVCYLAEHDDVICDRVPGDINLPPTNRPPIPKPLPIPGGGPPPHPIPIPIELPPLPGTCGPPPPAAACGGNSGLPWASGWSPGTGIGSIAMASATGFGGWRGRPVDVGIVFIGNNSWGKSYAAYLTNEVLGPNGAVRAFLNAKPKPICPVLTVPLVIASDAMKFAMVAAGGIDAEHTAIAKKIHEAAGEGTIYLRLGHEADHGYPWSYTNDGPAADPATYRAAWSRIAKIYKAEMPNARIVWNVLKNTRLKITDYYPGSDVVDVLSIDPYDNGAGGFCDSATSPGWVRGCYGDFDPATGVSHGVNGLLKFATTVGKRIAVDEWGASNNSLSGGDGANNSYYAAAMYDFFNAHADMIEYESYYNRAGGGRHQIWPRVDYNGNVSDAYLSKYKGDIPVPPASGPTCTPLEGGEECSATSGDGGVQALASDQAADEVGINTHINYLDTVYGSHYTDIIKPRLVELGVRHIRDNAGNDLVASRYRDLAASGIKLLLVNMKHEHHAFAAALGTTVVEAVEPPNESDNGSLMAETGPDFMRAFMTEMYPAYKNDPATAAMTVLGPSFARTSQSPAVFAAAIPNASSLMDAGNVHDYPGGTAPESAGGGGWGISLPEALRRYSALSGSKPIWSTETGYRMSDGVPGNPAISQRAAAKYMPREFLMHLKLGSPRVYPYQLINNREDFGVLNDDGSPRLQFTAMKNFIAMFKDAGAAFSPGTLDYTLTGDMTNIQQMLFQKRDGRFYLVVWQGVDSTGEPPRRNLTLTLNMKIAKATVYEPTFSMTPVNTYDGGDDGVKTITLSVPDHIQVIEMMPDSCVQTPAPAGKVCSSLGWVSGAFEPRPGFEALRPNNPAKSNICTVFTKGNDGAGTWADMMNASGGGMDPWIKAGCANLIISFRTLPGGEFDTNTCAANYRRIASGEFDHYYIAMLADLKAAGAPPNSVFRVGWELNSDYPWGLQGCTTAADAQAYIAGHRHIVDIIRANFSNQATFSWNFLKEGGKLKPSLDSYYPGNDYIDYINVDYYNSWPGANTTAALDALANQGSVAVPLGLNNWLAYAKSKGKKIGFDEWAIVPTERNGAGDNPVYLEWMFNWFKAHACDVAYESYFNGASRGHALDTGEHPLSTAKYRELWGAATSHSRAPDEVCSCTPAP